MHIEDVARNKLVSAMQSAMQGLQGIQGILYLVVKQSKQSVAIFKVCQNLVFCKIGDLDLNLEFRIRTKVLHKFCTYLHEVS